METGVRKFPCLLSHRLKESLAAEIFQPFLFLDLFFSFLKKKQNIVLVCCTRRLKHREGSGVYRRTRSLFSVSTFTSVKIKQTCETFTKVFMFVSCR